MPETVETTDPKWTGDEYNALERIFLPLMKDERDMIFLRTSAKITFTVWPMVILLFLSPGWLIGLLAVPYIAFVFVFFGGRYGLMLHAVGHRPVFKREYRWLGHYVPWVLGPLLGHTPTSFAAHHMFMHHAENNMLGDGSSTLPYERDRFLHFLHYWARFFFVGYLHLPRYLWLRGRRKIAIRFALGELSWMVGVAAAALFLNWAAALVVFVIPMLMMRWLMMCGNFAQHSFVDLDDPDNGFKNSTNLTNTRYNHKAYNDGYHIVHHIKPAMHWSDMARYYEDNVERFAEQDAIVFDGIRDNQSVWFLLMTHNYDKLANHLVDYKGRTHEEKVELLQSRVRRTRGSIPGFLKIESVADVARTKRGVSLDEALNAA